MKYLLLSKYALTFLCLLSTSAAGQLIRGGGNPWIDRCEHAICPSIKCAPGFISTVPEGKCCPVCVPNPKPPVLDCSKVQCRGCAADQDPVMVKGKCCPMCKPKVRFPDCSLVRCPYPMCTEGYEPVNTNSPCCPVCKPKKPDCRLVRCARVDCKEGFEPIVPDDQCCPVCKPKKPDCSLVRCALPFCLAGFEQVVPDGMCCPSCQPKNPVATKTTPCPMMACTDPCFTFSTEQKAFVSMCAADEECVTEIEYSGDDNDVDCPGCPHFVACK